MVVCRLVTLLRLNCGGRLPRAGFPETLAERLEQNINPVGLVQVKAGLKAFHWSGMGSCHMMRRRGGGLLSVPGRLI